MGDKFVILKPDGTWQAQSSPFLEGSLVGEIKIFAGALLPFGWRWCSGETVAAADYPSLTMQIGGAYGTTTGDQVSVAGDVSTDGKVTFPSTHGLSVGSTFLMQIAFKWDVTAVAGYDPNGYYPFIVDSVLNSTEVMVKDINGDFPRWIEPVSTLARFFLLLPDLRCRVPAGRDKMGHTETNLLSTLPVGGGDYIAEKAGAQRHTLLLAEMPSHTHSVGGGQNSVNRTNTGNATAGTGGGNTGSAGSNGAHNNLQPLLTVNYIIRVQ